ncbi:3-methyladenine DNA glycosylase AlkD [Paenibacillus sophorae]|uniref:3-methyladenine DNA glycosylase AlkD n=1 Tax=Paenibacillus sophorae TaxID=1333845 RepID=A0A1H8K2H9_9BACL|nr:DNA alkylation repair protein [Paenibacillus sophorae]QWU13567.1 DNA alkylation repair protein [Paenibacillus sophorae]SEN86847.1 3-methyladenine DNA glycosylase AlkD [Paenibacillus sophorae]
MNEDLKLLARELEELRDPDAAAAMSAYQRNQFPFLGVRTPLRRQVLKSFLAAHQPKKEWIPLLWEMPEREYQYCGVDIAQSLRKKLEPADLPMIETCITRHSWWDTVDLLAASVAGFLLRKYPELQPEYGEKWLYSDNMWLNRTAILFQLHYKEATDERLLYNYIREHASSNEFFIQKAIGWALREYSKSNPASVAAFIEQEELKPLSRREGLKWLMRAEKTK